MNIKIKKNNNQSGFMLTEVLLSIIIFLIGALSMLNLLAVSVADTAQSKYRNDAANLSNNLIGLIYLDTANLSSYDDSNTTYAPKISWQNSVAAALPRFCPTTPCSTAQTNVSVNATTRTVQITIRWRAPKDTADHTYQSISNISTN